MTYAERKKRRIEYIPPLPLKREIETYSKGNMTEFITDAVRDKIKSIKANSKMQNAVGNLLR